MSVLSAAKDLARKLKIEIPIEKCPQKRKLIAQVEDINYFCSRVSSDLDNDEFLEYARDFERLINLVHGMKDIVVEIEDNSYREKVSEILFSFASKINKLGEMMDALFEANGITEDDLHSGVPLKIEKDLDISSLKVEEKEFESIAMTEKPQKEEIKVKEKKPEEEKTPEDIFPSISLPTSSRYTSSKARIPKIGEIEKVVPEKMVPLKPWESASELVRIVPKTVVRTFDYACELDQLREYSKAIEQYANIGSQLKHIFNEEIDEKRKTILEDAINIILKRIDTLKDLIEERKKAEVEARQVFAEPTTVSSEDIGTLSNIPQEIRYLRLNNPWITGAAVVTRNGILVWQTPNWDVSRDVSHLIKNIQAGVNILLFRDVNYRVTYKTPEGLIATNDAGKGHIILGASPEFGWLIVHVVSDIDPFPIFGKTVYTAKSLHLL